MEAPVIYYSDGAGLAGRAVTPRRGGRNVTTGRGGIKVSGGAARIGEHEAWFRSSLVGEHRMGKAWGSTGNWGSGNQLGNRGLGINGALRINWEIQNTNQGRLSKYYYLGIQLGSWWW